MDQFCYCCEVRKKMMSNIFNNFFFRQTKNKKKFTHRLLSIHWFFFVLSTRWDSFQYDSRLWMNQNRATKKFSENFQEKFKKFLWKITKCFFSTENNNLNINNNWMQGIFPFLCVWLSSFLLRSIFLLKLLIFSTEWIVDNTHEGDIKI